MAETGIPDTTLTRVRALLAKAEGAANEAEAAAYNAKATELMAKYGIDAALAAERQPANDTPTDKVIVVENPRAMLKARLLMRIGQAMRCETIRIVQPRGMGDGTQKVHVFGFTSDVERVEVMYTSLLLQMMSGLAAITIAPRGVSLRTYKNSWGLGFATRVAERIGAAEEAAVDEAPAASSGRSTALVLADRSRVIDQRFRSEYPQVRRSSTSYNPDGFGAGAQAGNRADIGHARVGGHRPGLPS